jgi:hypothetical protein
MPTDLTVPSEDACFESLPSDQQQAITALAEGCTFTAAAERAGVARVTLWRWLKNDPDFAAAYLAWKKELAEAARAKLLASAGAAANTLINAINAGDAKLALALLTRTGVIAAPEAK